MFLKAINTDQFDHIQAQLLMYTGSSRLGKPSMGSWVSYGLGSGNENLPNFIVLTSGGYEPSGTNLWGSGFLPSVHQGTHCQTDGKPLLYLENPTGVSLENRKASIAAINDINRKTYDEFSDPETITRIAQYEMAYRMQISVPEVMNIQDEPEHIHELYGTEIGKNSFANNALLARKLVEKGVRFIQLFDYGWDSHGENAANALNIGFLKKCKTIDQPIAALIIDLKRRGLLDQTLVVWGGEFGRTPMEENRFGKYNEYIGRDHHPDAFTIWMAGGGVKNGITHGATDDLGYYPVLDKHSIYDVQATILNQLGFDHEKLTFPFQGRNQRLTDVHGEVIRDVIL